MKIFKSSKAYGAFEYVTIIALIIAVAIIIMQMAKGKTIGSGNILDTALGKANSIIGSPGGPGGVVKEITVAYSGPFNYDYEKDLETAVTEYLLAFAEIKDKDDNIRTDYIVESVSKVGGFIQINIRLDGENFTKQFPVTEICHLATDSDFSGITDGTFRYIGTAKCVEIPLVIKGVNVTSYEQMFSNTSVEKVISTNLNVTNMTTMFYNSQATSLDLSNFDTSNVTNMSFMFANSQATTLDLSSFYTSNVTDMTSIFQNSQATTIDLSSFDTSNVTTMSLMFFGSKATSLDLSSFNTSNVTNMKYMFSSSQATSLDLSNFDTSNVTNMSNMFTGSQATTLDLSSFDTSKVTNMNNMFAGSQATSGYAKTTADRDKFNASTNKPAGLIFTVK